MKYGRRLCESKPGRLAMANEGLSDDDKIRSMLNGRSAGAVFVLLGEPCGKFMLVLLLMCGNVCDKAVERDGPMIENANKLAELSSWSVLSASSRVE
jgi:hypothetical protein